MRFHVLLLVALLLSACLWLDQRVLAQAADDGSAGDAGSASASSPGDTSASEESSRDAGSSPSASIGLVSGSGDRANASGDSDNGSSSSTSGATSDTVGSGDVAGSDADFGQEPSGTASNGEFVRPAFFLWGAHRGVLHVLTCVCAGCNVLQAGWSVLNSTDELPSAFKFNAQATNDEDGAYVAFCGVAASKPLSLWYPTASNTSGSAIALSANLSTDTLLGIDDVTMGTTGNVKMTNLAKQYWSIDDTNRAIKYVDDAHKASEFVIYINAKRDALFLKSGPFYVALPDVSSDDETLWASVTLVSSSLFRAPVAASQSGLGDLVTDMDSYVVGYRRAALQANGAVSSAWLAYDWALALPLDQPTNKFQLPDNVSLSDRDVFRVLDKAFALVAGSMRHEYSAYPSLGYKLPAKLNLYFLASHLQGDSNQTWVQGTKFFAGAFPEDADASYHLGAATVMQAKVQEQLHDTSFLQTPADDEPAIVRAYFWASCVLASRAKNLTFAEQVNATQVLLPSNESLTIPASSGAFEQYWFSDLINAADTNSTNGTTGPSASTKLRQVLEVALLKYLPGDFISAHSTIGDSVSKPLFDAIDEALSSTEGMDVDGMYKLMATDNIGDVMHAVDYYCGLQGIQVPLCVLPQILRQAGVFSMYQRDVTVTNVTTNLARGVGANGDSVNLDKYLELLQKNKDYYTIRQAIQKAKADFISKYKTFADDLTTKVEDSTIEGAVESAKAVSTSTVSLSTYVAKTADFRKNGANAKLNQQLMALDQNEELLNSSKDAYTKRLKTIGTNAEIKATMDAVVAAVGAAFDVVNVGKSFRKGSDPDVGGLGSAVSGIQYAVKEVEAAADTFQLVDQLNGLAPELDGVIKKMADVGPSLKRVRDTAQPLVSGGSMSATDLQVASNAFLQAMTDYSFPLSATEIDSLQSRFTTITERLCAKADLKADQNCIKVGGDAAEVFGNLVESVTVTNDALQSLVDMATESINSRSSSMLADQVKQNQATAVASFDTIEAQWKGDDAKRQLWWFTWRKQQAYLNAVASVGTVLNQVYIFTALVQKCDRDTYLNGGVPSDDCDTYVYSPAVISDDGIKKVISSTEPGSSAATTTTAWLPTAPEYPGDLAFVNIGQLMDGQTAYFKLPADNETWLHAHKWLKSKSDLTDAVMYVTQMTVVLPPRFADFKSQDSQVKITVRSTGKSELGPALKGKSFLIPPRKFLTSYDLTPDNKDCDTHEYQECDPSIPNYCFSEKGTSDNKDRLNPSLFGDWAITAEFPNNNKEAARIAYRSVVSPLPVYFNVAIQMHSVENSRRSLREKGALATRASGGRSLRAQANDRCCPVGHFRAQVDGESQCLVCPSESKSQLGGLFCVRAPHGNHDNSSGTGDGVGSGNSGFGSSTSAGTNSDASTNSAANSDAGGSV